MTDNQILNILIISIYYIISTIITAKGTSQKVRVYLEKFIIEKAKN